MAVTFASGVGGMKLTPVAILGLTWIIGCQSPRSPVADAAFPKVGDSAVRMQKPDTGTREPALKRTVFQAVPVSFPTPKNVEESVRIRAHVNGVPIFHDEVQQLVYPSVLNLSPQLSEAERKAREEQIYKEGLQQVIDRELVLQDMEGKMTRNNAKQYLTRLKEAAAKEFDKTMKVMKQRSGVKTDEEFKALLRRQGQGLEGVRRQFERNFMAREYMKGMVYPRIERWTGHQEIVDYYRDHPQEFQQVDGVKWNDIFVDVGQYRTREEAKATAEQLANRARSGVKFTELLKYDNGDASYRNGEGFGQHRGEIKPTEAEPVLFAMNEGEVRVLEVPNGYHVIQLVKRDRAGLIPLDDKTQDLIRKKLQMQIAEREMKRFVDELKQKALIEIDSADFHSAARR
jgi:parvulin-like peptidyl-prolyl isomerase